MASLTDISVTQLRQALQLREQIDSLQKQLSAVLGGSVEASAAPAGEKAAPVKGRRKRTMSAEARARISAATTARWERTRAAAAKPAKSPKAVAKSTGGKKRPGLTPEGRAKLAAAMKARWAARKKGDPAPNASAS